MYSMNITHTAALNTDVMPRKKSTFDKGLSPTGISGLFVFIINAFDA